MREGPTFRGTKKGQAKRDEKVEEKDEEEEGRNSMIKTRTLSEVVGKS